MKLLLTILFALITSISIAQVTPTGQTYTGTNYRGGVGADSATWMAVVTDTTAANSLFTSFRRKGRFFIGNSGEFWFHNGTKWDQVVAIAVLTSYVKYSDTSAMLFPYLRKSDAFATYVKYTDTAIMLLPYLRKVDTTAMLLPYLRSNVAAASYWGVDGNSTSTTKSMGTTSSQAFNFISNNLVRGTVAANGSWTLGASTFNTETVITLRNDQTGRMFFDIGRGSSFSTNQFAITFDQTGAGTTFTRLSSLGTEMTLQGNTIALLTTAATASPTFLGGDNNSLGGFIKVSARRPWSGAATFSPTASTSVAVSWENNGSNTNYIPSSGTNQFIWSRFNPVIMATGTYAGSVEGFVFDPTLTSIANGTAKAFKSTNNIGRALSLEGTAISVIGGRILQGTTTDNTIDGYQSPNPIRALLFKATTPNAGATTDNVVVWNSATQEYRNIGAFSVLVQPRDTTVTSNTTATLLSTVRNYHYSFTGTTATWTLPTVASSFSSGNGVTYHIKNRGSGNLTINTAASGNDIYSSSAVNTYVLLPGEAITLHNDNTYFNVE